MFRWVRKLRDDHRGATAVEYGLILALIFLVIVGAVRALATHTTNMWNNVSERVVNAA